MIDTSSLVVREILKKLGATDEMIREKDPMLEKLLADASEYRWLTPDSVIRLKKPMPRRPRVDRDDGLL